MCVCVEGASRLFPLCQYHMHSSNLICVDIFVFRAPFRGAHAKLPGCGSIRSSTCFFVKLEFLWFKPVSNHMFGQISEGMSGGNLYESLFGQINPIHDVTPACRVVFTKQLMPMSYQQKLWANAVGHSSNQKSSFVGRVVSMIFKHRIYLHVYTCLKLVT